MKYARQCSVTKEGMNAGYVIQDGKMYIKYEKDLIAHIRSIEGEDVSKDRLTDEWLDEWLLNEYYEDGYYYYTEWDDKDDFQYEIINGTLTLIQD